MKKTLDRGQPGEESQNRPDWTSGSLNSRDLGLEDSTLGPTGPGVDSFSGRGLLDSVPSPRESSTAESGPPLKLERTGLNRQFQKHLFDREELARTNLFSKLQPLSDKVPHWDNFRKCGSTTSMSVWCGECGETHVLNYRCLLKWCPKCMPVLSWRRQRVIALWATQVKQPKHIVVTARNTAEITRVGVREFTRALVRLRRSKLFNRCEGGCTALEVTNEGRGWHLHAHMLADVRFVDARELAVKWGKLVGQDFAIVKVQDGRNRNYVAECSKYVVKGNEIAAWTGEQSLAFIKAFDGIRTFTRFGSMRKRSDFIEASIEAAKPVAKCKKCKSESVELLFGAREFLRHYRVPS